MNQIESKFLLAVEKGDINTLKSLLDSRERENLNINCCDPLARSALVIAIDNENTEIVKLLIEANVNIGDALLYAIDENFVEAVELLLDHELASKKPGEPKSWELDREDSYYSADLTPLILAAHRDNFEIIKILIDRQVAQLPDPHDPRCKCQKCCESRAEDCLKYSRSRINAYRALASPCLMALSSPDPLLTTFKMSAKLESLANFEPEYKQDYLKLRAQCQKFATKLLDHTRTSEELEILLNYSDDFTDPKDGHKYDDAELAELPTHDFGNASIGNTFSTGFDINSTMSARNFSFGSGNCVRNHLLTPGCNFFMKSRKRATMGSLDSVTGRQESYMSDMRLARLRLAIQCKQKTFCAHPNIQELLSTMWYENLPGFRQRSMISQTLQILMIGLLFPVYSIAYLVAPHSQLGRYIKKPFIKFICHSASYITFLIILILASQRVEAFYCWGRVIGLFSEEEITPIISHESNISALKQLRPTTSSFDADNDLSTLAALYQLNSQKGSSSARGLESLGKIFEQLPASSKRRGTVPSPIELLILLWVISLIWAEIKQLKALGMNYYKADMWNALDSVASGFYIGTIILRLCSYFETDKASMEIPREHWPAYDPTLISEALFATATIFSSLKLVYIFSVNPYLGPLQISLGRMIIDILRFSWIYMLVLFSFAVGMNQLLWYYADLERHQCLNITNYNLAQYYTSLDINTHSIQQSSSVPVPSDSNSKTVVIESSPSMVVNTTLNSTSADSLLKKLTDQQNMTEEKLMEAAFSASLEDELSKPPITLDDSCKTWRHFSNLFESTQTLFWANFGLVDLENFELTGIRQYTRFWALLIFGCYCFINVIVVLNLLIAMMNHSYVRISKKSDVEWKFARTRLWMSYFDTGSTVPAPFNIIPSIKSIINLTCLFTSHCCKVTRGFLWWCLPNSCFRAKPTNLSKGGIINRNNNKNEQFNNDNNAHISASANSTLASIYSENNDTRHTSAYVTADATLSEDFLNPIPGNKSADSGNGNDKRPNSRACKIPCCKLGTIKTMKNRAERHERYCNLTASYRSVIRALIRRYLVNEQRLLERKRELTEAKLNRWVKLNAFE